MRKRAVIVLTMSLTIPVLLISATFLFYNNIYNSILEESKKDEIIKSDVIIVFGAAIGYKGQPSAVLKARIEQAYKLYANNFAPKLILTGGIGWGPPAESVVMKKILSRKGVPLSAMFFETKSKTTKAQILFSVKTMKENNFHKALLVSDPYHNYRLKKYFSDSGIKVYSAPARSLRRTSESIHKYVQMETIKVILQRFFGK